MVAHHQRQMMMRQRLMLPGVLEEGTSRNLENSRSSAGGALPPEPAEILSRIHQTSQDWSQTQSTLDADTLKQLTELNDDLPTDQRFPSFPRTLVSQLAKRPHLPETKWSEWLTQEEIISNIRSEAGTAIDLYNKKKDAVSKTLNASNKIAKEMERAYGVEIEEGSIADTARKLMIERRTTDFRRDMSKFGLGDCLNSVESISKWMASIQEPPAWSINVLRLQDVMPTIEKMIEAFDAIENESQSFTIDDLGSAFTAAQEEYASRVQASGEAEGETDEGELMAAWSRKIYLRAMTERTEREVQEGG